MIGSPDDDEDTIKQTIEYSKKLPNQLVQFSVFTPYPGTPMFTDYEKKITTKKYQSFNQYNLVYKHDKLDQTKIDKLKKLAYFKFYFNFNNLNIKIKSLISIIV